MSALSRRSSDLLKIKYEGIKIDGTRSRLPLPVSSSLSPRHNVTFCSAFSFIQTTLLVQSSTLKEPDSINSSEWLGRAATSLLTTPPKRAPGRREASSITSDRTKYNAG